MLNLKATLVVKQNFLNELIMMQGVKSSLSITLTDVRSLWEDPTWCALHPLHTSSYLNNLSGYQQAL